jgi:hypothetical protein
MGVTRTILDGRSAGPILRVTHPYSHGSDLTVRHTRAVVCFGTSGSWQGPMLLCRSLRQGGFDAPSDYGASPSQPRS